MKKVYMLFAALAFVGMTTAQNYDWNISSDDFNALGAVTEEVTVDGLTIYNKVEVDKNNKKDINEVQYTHRLKLGGKGVFDAEGLPVDRIISFEVDGNVDISIYGLSSSSGSDRKLNVSAGTKDNIIGEADAPGDPLTITTISYEGEGTTIFLWSPDSGVNIYRIIVEGDTPVSVKPVLENANVVGVDYYNISGANMGASLDFLPSGVYIEVTKFDNGTVDTKKVVKK